MKLLIGSSCCLLMLGLVAGAGPVSGQDGKLFEEMDPSVSYSAWRHVATRDTEMKMREYHAPGKQRFEMQAQGQEMVMIHRADTGRSWMLMPEMQAYMQTSADRVAQSSGTGVEVVERTRMGRETVSGHDAVKYRAVFRDSQGRTSSGYFWITEEHGIPIRTEMTQQTASGEQPLRMELTDLRVAAQPASLFEVPADYQVLPGGMPATGSMGGMSGNDGVQGTGDSGQSYLDLLAQQQAQKARQEQQQAAEHEAQQAALSRLTRDYLEGCWLSVDGERAQLRINADGSYDVGLPAGSGFAMQRTGSSIEEFRSRYLGLVEKSEDRFVVRNQHRNLTYRRNPCMGGGGVAGDGSGVSGPGTGSAQQEVKKSVVDEATDKLKKGIGSFFDKF